MSAAHTHPARPASLAALDALLVHHIQDAQQRALRMQGEPGMERACMFWCGYSAALQDLKSGQLHRLAAARQARLDQMVQRLRQGAQAGLAVGAEALAGVDEGEGFAAQGVKGAGNGLADVQIDAVEQLKNGAVAGGQLHDEKAEHGVDADDGAVRHADSCGQKTVILSLPQGMGKSTLAPALAQRLGCTHIVDEWREDMPVQPGALHLHQCEQEGAQ